MSRERHVFLLRGINVGGKNKLPMKTLVRMCEELDCREVSTYIQSGNVVFTPPAKLATLPARLSERIESELGLTVPVILRSASELASLVDRNPFLAEGADPKTLHVAFLADEPSAEAARQLDPDRSPGDRYILSGSEIFSCCPRGLARTKLSNDYFDRTLATTSTGRNWRTVLALIERSG